MREEISSRDVLSVREVAQRLGLSRAAAYRAAASGQIPALRIGARIVVPLVRYERLLAGELEPCPECRDAA